MIDTQWQNPEMHASAERQGDSAGGGVRDRAGQGDKRQAVYNRKEGVCEGPPPHTQSMAFRGCGMFLSYLDKHH